MMKKFDAMNPDRNREGHARMNLAQHQHLLLHFFQPSGEHRTLCRRHLVEYASISQGKVQELKETAQHPVDWERPVLDQPRSRLNYPPHNLALPQVDVAFLDFLEEYSLPLPNREGFVLDSRFNSKRAVYRSFVEETLAPLHLTLAWGTFCIHWKNLRPDVVLHNNKYCVCSKCTGWKSIVESYKNKPSDECTIFPFPHVNSLSSSLTHSVFLKAERLFKEHTVRVQVERRLYMQTRKAERVNPPHFDTPTAWATIDAQQHLSIDAMQTLAIPTFGSHDQPAESFYHSTLSLTPMGVFDEVNGEAVIYLYDATAPRTCSNSVISCIDRYLTDHQYGCKSLLVNMDNFNANKSHVVPLSISSSLIPPSH